MIWIRAGGNRGVPVDRSFIVFDLSKFSDSIDREQNIGVHES
jgi:hypothetical protein